MASGEEIITKLASAPDSSPGTREFIKPRILILGKTQGGQQGLQLIPWFFSDPDGTALVNEDHIMAIMLAPKHIADGYLQETSGIQLAM